MTANLLCLTGLFLVIRHGLDLDHITAISDLVSAKVSASADSAFNTGKHSVKAQSFILAGMYALGHALVVTVLGLAALLFRITLPELIDPIMQKVVGLTLLLLGLWMLHCMRVMKMPQSRGSILLHGIFTAKQVIFQRSIEKKIPAHVHDPSEFCNARCALAIGALHGIGAETGTQVLLLSSMGGANGFAGSLLLLGSFVAGMLAANIGLAILISESYVKAIFSKPFIMAMNITVAIISIVIGVAFILGKADLLGI